MYRHPVHSSFSYPKRRTLFFFMAALVRKLRDMGFAEARYVDTAASIFGRK